MFKPTAILAFALVSLSYFAQGDELVNIDQLRSISTVDEKAAITIALEYFRKTIHPNGPDELKLMEPNIFMDSTRKQWIVSWVFENDERIVIVVNAESGIAYQADTGVD